MVPHRQWTWEHRCLIETPLCLDAHLQRKDCGVVCRWVWTERETLELNLSSFTSLLILNYNPRMRQLVGERCSLVLVTYYRRIWHWHASVTLKVTLSKMKCHSWGQSDVSMLRALAEDPVSTWHQIIIIITPGPGGLTSSPNHCEHLAHMWCIDIHAAKHHTCKIYFVKEFLFLSPTKRE